MMGNDVERILSGINAVKDATISCINSLSNATSYQIISDAAHAGTAYGPCAPEEVPNPIIGYTFIDPIKEAMTSIEEDCGKMNDLSKGLYTNVNSFNNGYGSPWTELSVLSSTINMVESFISSHANLDWIGDKSALLALLNTILSTSIDAKWALIYYHDYIQRGYDTKYNGNEPSIKFTSGIDKQSIGNINQEFHENVNIKQPSIDPF